MSAQTRPTVFHELERQGALFEKFSVLDESGLGGDDIRIPTYKDHLRDLRLYRGLLTGINAVRTTGMDDEQRLSHDSFAEELQHRIRDEELKTFEMPLAAGEGLHRTLAGLPNSLPFNTAHDYQDYVHKLREIPTSLGTAQDLARHGIRDGIVPAQYLLEKAAAQCNEIISDDPFLLPLAVFPPSVSPEDQQRLQREIKAIVKDQVLPAYKALESFIRRDYVPHARVAIGLSALPDGARRYRAAIQDQTTTTLSAEQVHRVGLQEVDRIQALLTDVAHRAGYADLASYREALNRDPRYVPRSPQQIVDDFSRYVSSMSDRLPELFNDYPHTSMIVEAESLTEAGFGTHHVDGPPDGSAPGRIVVAVSDFSHRKLISDETQAYHEGIPGHELQVSIQQRLRGIPKFRKDLRNTAYVEGWAVYAEALGKELGFFQDPASDYGRLNLELMRAVRLVVDTGINSQGWTREQAVDYFRKSGAADEPTLQAEIDRYVNWPAQSLGYKIGQMKFLELRERAKRVLGDRFDIRSFHDAVLKSGSLPLDLLDARVNEWIRDQSTSTAQQTSGDGPHPGP